MVAGDALGLHAGTGLGVEEQGVQLLHMTAGFNKLCRHRVGVSCGGGELEAAGVGGNAGVQAVRNVGGDSHPHLHDDLIQQFRCRSGTGIQKGKIGIAVVACVVVDAQVYMACVLRHTVIFAKQLQTGHVHRNHGAGLELALEQPWVCKGIAGRNGIGAEHRCCFFQRFERIVQGAAAADGVTVRVFVAQNQNVVRSQQALRHLLHIQLFCHPMIHPFRKGSQSSVCSVSAGCASSSPFTFRLRSSSLMWAA